MANLTNPQIGTVESAAPFKEGGKLLKVVIDGEVYRAFDPTFLSKIGQEIQFEWYSKDNEWQGQVRKEKWLKDLTPRQFKPKQSAAPAASPMLAEINKKLDTLLDAMENIQLDMATKKEPKKPEIPIY